MDNKHKIDKILNTYYENISDEGKKALELFLTNPKLIDTKQNTLLKNMILDNINKNKTKIIKKSPQNFKTLISFISFAKPDNFDISPIEKTIILFPSIETFFLLHTNGSKKNAYDLKIKLENSNKCTVILKEIDIDDYNEVYSEISEYIFKYDIIEKDDFLIDATLGQKMVFDAFNRFSIENGMKILTWQNEMEDINGRQTRLPGTEISYFNEAPERANYISYKSADKLFNQYKFKEASYIYESINNKNMKELCDLLGDIFTYENLYDLDVFIETINNSRIFEFKNIDKKLIEQLKELKNIFKTLIKDENFDIYKAIYSHFIVNHYNSISLIHNILKEKIDAEEWEIKTKDFKKNMSMDDILNVLRLKLEPLELYPLEKNEFSMNISGKMTFENKLLSIPHKKINNLKLKSLTTTSRFTAIIEALFENKNYILYTNNLIYFRKNEYSLKDIIENNTKDEDKLEKMIKKIMKEKTKNDKFIAYRNKFKIKIKEINDEIYKKIKIKDFLLYKYNNNEYTLELNLNNIGIK